MNARQDWVRTGVLITGVGFVLWVMVVHLVVVTFCTNPARYVSAVLLAVGSGAVATGLGLPAEWIGVAATAGFVESLRIRLERFP